MNSYISDDLKVKIFRENDHELFKRVKDRPETTEILYQHYRKIFSNWRLSLHIVTYIIEYLVNTDFIFKMFLWDESKDQVSSFYIKKPTLKISCLGIFKEMAKKYWRPSQQCFEGSEDALGNSQIKFEIWLADFLSCVQMFSLAMFRWKIHKKKLQTNKNHETCSANCTACIRTYKTFFVHFPFEALLFKNQSSNRNI